MEQSYPGRMLGRVERSETRRSLSPSRAPAGCARLSPAFTRPTAVSAKFTVGVTLKPLRQQCFFVSGTVGNSGITARKQQINSDKVDLSGRPLGVSRLRINPDCWMVRLRTTLNPDCQVENAAIAKINCRYEGRGSVRARPAWRPGWQRSGRQTRRTAGRGQCPAPGRSATAGLADPASRPA